jgi:hypothetical protein
MHFPLKLVPLLCAELYLIIVRVKQITILFKRRDQRRQSEQQVVDRGLFRSMVLEAFLFVPVSAALATLIVLPLMMQTGWAQRASTNLQLVLHGLVGLISYGFPYALVRTLITRMAYKTLVEFTAICSEHLKQLEDENEDREKFRSQAPDKK